MEITIELPQKVRVILDRLRQGGYEGYAVGGCVRDALLGRIPHDWDITTSAKPLETKSLFERTIDTGIQHGTVTVMIDHEGFEVTTYRIDGEYEDSRHPKEVAFTANLIEDLKRRDFTINAMAYNETDGLVDEFDGVKDLKEKKIRCVGDPRERFGEDALRILRAVRFSAQLGFCVEEKTKEAVRELAPTLRAISAERIQTELVKLLLSPNPQMMRDVAELGITSVVMPEFDEALERRRILSLKEGKALSDTEEKREDGRWFFNVACFCPPEKSIRLAAILWILGENAEKSAQRTLEVLRRLKFDNDTIEKTVTLVRFHDLRVEPEKTAIRKAIYEVGEERFPALLMLWRAELEAKESGKEFMAAGQSTGEKAVLCQESAQEKLRQIEKLYEEIIKDGDCLSLRMLAVTGRDLLDAGMKPGKEVGERLTKMLFDVLEHPEHNTKEYLLYSVFR